MVFRMAHDAIYHGLLPATSNIASIRIVNPPAVIYLLMLPAAFSANPLWGAIFVAFLNVIAVLLTYIFVRRYYGRLAAVIASLLYVTASKPLYFSRFIWQQNLIAPFVILFIFALFWGVVDRRKGWLFPALLLLGILFQLHETTIILCVPLLLALLLAPGTVRWRDLALGMFSLLLIFFTYLLWEFSTKLADLNVILQMLKLHAHFDSQVLAYYIQFLSPYDQFPTNTHTLLYSFAPYLVWLRPIMLLFVLGGFATAFIAIVLYPRMGGGRLRRPRPDEGIFHIEEQESQESSIEGEEGDASVPTPPPHHSRPYALLDELRTMWTEFRADPRRCGFVLLLTWQVVPVLILTRHAVPLFSYYLLLLMPGPFILIGLFLSMVIDWLQRRGRRWNMPRYGLYVLAGIVIIAQLLGSIAGLIDETSGNNLHGYSYNTLNSLQAALTEADQLAQQRHLNHVYVATDQYTQVALRYLAEQMQTPTTLFDASHCLVLPNPTGGPAVLLVGPYDKLTGVLLGQFAVATLIDQPERLGGAPFQLYIVQPTAESNLTSTTQAFINNLQLLDNQAQHLSFANSTWLATRWSYMRSASPKYRTTYTYKMNTQLNGNEGLSVSSQCVSTSIRAGDQLIVTFQLPKGASAPASITIFATSYTTSPHDLLYGPFHLENIRDQSTQPVTLHTTAGTVSITLAA